MSDIVIVGLGNPGAEYENTRHNTGRLALELFRRDNDFPDWAENKKYAALVSSGKIGKVKVLCFEPETFMNKSGKALAGLISGAKKAERLVVIHDDLDLPIGRFKISFNRSAGGHRGVQSVIRAVKTEGFVRIRIGISPAGAKGKVKKLQGGKAVLDHILGKFKPAELAILKKVFKKAAEALAMIASSGREQAMATYNNS